MYGMWSVVYRSSLLCRTLQWQSTLWLSLLMRCVAYALPRGVGEAMDQYICHLLRAICLTMQKEVTKFGIDKENMFEFWDVSDCKLVSSQQGL